MYLLALVYENAGLNASGEFSLNGVQRTIAKWTLLDAGARNTELLQLSVASYNGILLSRRFPTAFNALRGTAKGPLLAAHLRVLHEGTDTRMGHGLEATAGITATAHEEVRPLWRSRGGLFFEDAVLRDSHGRPNPHRDFLLAYGAAPRARQCIRACPHGTLHGERQAMTASTYWGLASQTTRPVPHAHRGVPGCLRSLVRSLFRSPCRKRP